MFTARVGVFCVDGADAPVVVPGGVAGDTVCAVFAPCAGAAVDGVVDVGVVPAAVVEVVAEVAVVDVTGVVGVVGVAEVVAVVVEDAVDGVAVRIHAMFAWNCVAS